MYVGDRDVVQPQKSSTESTVKNFLSFQPTYDFFGRSGIETFQRTVSLPLEYVTNHRYRGKRNPDPLRLTLKPLRCESKGCNAVMMGRQRKVVLAVCLWVACMTLAGLHTVIIRYRQSSPDLLLSVLLFVHSGGDLRYRTFQSYPGLL